MNMTEVSGIQVGTEVRCKLDGPEENAEWFTAKVIENHGGDSSGYGFSLRRDDVGFSWGIRVHSYNCKLIEPLFKEWDHATN